MKSKVFVLFLGAVLGVAGVIAYQITDRVIINHRRQVLETQSIQAMCADLEKNGGHSAMCQQYSR